MYLPCLHRYDHYKTTISLKNTKRLMCDVCIISKLDEVAVETDTCTNSPRWLQISLDLSELCFINISLEDVIYICDISFLYSNSFFVLPL